MLTGEHVTAECCGVKCGVMVCVLTGEHVTAECCGEVWSDDVC